MSTKTSARSRFPAAFAAALCVLELVTSTASALSPDRRPAGEAPRNPGITVRKAPAPARAELTAWHRRYEPEASAVKAAVATLFAARDEVDPTRYERRYRLACAGLGRALAPFADRERRDDLYPAADAAARFHLRRAYAALSRTAAAGADGRFQDAELALADSARWFHQAAVVLERYGLEP